MGWRFSWLVTLAGSSLEQIFSLMENTPFTDKENFMKPYPSHHVICVGEKAR